MSLAKSIVIKNQFFNKNNQAYGSTPAKFVENYMARNDATLTVYPVKNGEKSQNSLDQSSVYQIQKNNLLTNRETFAKKQPTHKNWFNLTTLEGRSFNQESFSLSKGELKKQADKLQQAFDQGHTMLKLVFSYDNDYLENLNVEKPGSTNLNFHENVDEMKLRSATQKGCSALAASLGYTSPLYLGSIQLDRDHPHAHIVLCESASKNKSNAKRFKDGSEYGKLSIKNRHDVRRAIDQDLTINQNLAFMSSDNLERAQKTNELYSNRYANLVQEKQVMIIKSLPKEDLVSKKIADSLYHGVAKKTGKSVQDVKTKLEPSLFNANKSDSMKNMPALIYLQILNLKRRRDRKKYSKYLKKARQNKQNKLNQSKKNDRLLATYHSLKHYSNNHPLDEALIEQKIMPYYQASLNRNSQKLDYYANQNFTPVQKLPNHVKQSYAFLNKLNSLGLSGFDKSSTDEMIDLQVNSWQKQGYISCKDFIKHLNQPDYLPKPTEYGELSKTELPTPQKLDRMLERERDLANEALLNAQDLSDKYLKMRIQSDCYNTLHEEPLNKKAYDTLPNQDVILKSNDRGISSQVQLSNKSLGYQAANKLIVNSLNS